MLTTIKVKSARKSSHTSSIESGITSIIGRNVGIPINPKDGFINVTLVTRPRDFTSRGFRHPCTGQYKKRSATFMCQGTDRKGKEQLYVLYDISSTPIIRHIKVKGNVSPDDSSLREYWQQRSTRNGKNYWAKGSKYEQIAKFQNWKCPMCGDSLFNGEPIETHHILPVAEGGTDDSENLMHLHRACHKQVHS